ncbi:MAG: hypothetical protein IPJ17_07190 [Holophagales bacterium]|nr:MAG: hypothetical protein IPJ17_07190 [Holophagales bacterium]
MTPSATRKNPFWPEITDLESAASAARSGFWAAAIVAAVTAAVATWAAVSGASVLSINSWAYLDAIFFAVIAWGIRRYSRAFAVAGMLLFTVEKALLFVENGAAGWPLALVLLLMFIAGVRGTVGYHRYAARAAEAGRPPAPSIENRPGVAG